MRALRSLFGSGSSTKRDKAPSTSTAAPSARRQASEPAPYSAPPGLAPPPTLDVDLPARSPLRVPGADSVPLNASTSSSSIGGPTTTTTSGGSWVQIGRTGNELAKRPIDAVLNPQQALELLEACSSVIQQRGLDVLCVYDAARGKTDGGRSGIFRPHLDRADIGRLIELFVATLPDAVAAAESTTRIALPTELFGEAANPKQTFRQEVRSYADHVIPRALFVSDADSMTRYAGAHALQLQIENVHNVVALLRWVR